MVHVFSREPNKPSKDNPIGFTFRLTNLKSQLTPMVTTNYKMKMEVMSLENTKQNENIIYLITKNFHITPSWTLKFYLLNTCICYMWMFKCYNISIKNLPLKILCSLKNLIWVSQHKTSNPTKLFHLTNMIHPKKKDKKIPIQCLTFL